MIKLAIVCSIPFFIVSHLDFHLKKLNNKKFSITLICKNDKLLNRYKKYKNIKIYNINFERKVSIISDIKSLVILYFHLLFNRYDIVHSYTPKVGMLTSICSLFSLKKVRIHTFTGQHWKNKKNFSRIFYKLIDKIIIYLNTVCFCDSFSQIDFLKKEELFGKKNKIEIIHNGSVGGVDLAKFNFSKFNKNELRLKFNLESNIFLILFVGRIHSDKGIFSLINAVINISNLKNRVKLFMIGPRDFSNIFEEEKFNNFLNNYNKTIKHFDYTPVIEEFLAVSNLFCLPSIREGFGTSVIEAGAMKLPVLVSDIYGLNEIVKNKVNGNLLKNNSVSNIQNNIIEIMNNYSITKKLSNNLYNDILQKYKSDIISNKLEKKYKELINTL